MLRHPCCPPRGGLEEMNGGVGASLLEVVKHVRAALGTEGKGWCLERHERGYKQ